jgi:CHAT domain-containing protein
MVTLNWKTQAYRGSGAKSWRGAQLAFGILLGCALTLLVLWLARPLAHPASQMEASGIAAQLGSVRLTMGRLGGQAAYAPYPTSIKSQDSQDLRRLCRGLTRKSTSPNAEELRDRAVCSLAAKKLDAAVTDLEAAIQIEPGNEALLSDLSALYGERAATEGRPEDYSAALEMAERAVALGSKRPEVIFNRAVALEHLFLHQEARDSWQLYLHLDQRSAWAEEARIHIAQLDRALVVRPPFQNHQQLMSQALVFGERSFAQRLAMERPQEAREILENELLPGWAFTMARQGKQADGRLAAARVISQELVRRGGDPIFLDILREMEKETGKSPVPKKTTLLVQALQHIGSGQQALQGLNIARARAELKLAEKAIGPSQSPVTPLLLFHRARELYYSGNALQAQEALDRLGRNPLLARYPSMEARRQWMLGLLAYRNADRANAIKAYLRAHDILNSQREQPNSAMVQLTLSEALRAEGQPAQAWRSLYPVMAWCSAAPACPKLHLAFNEAVLISLSQRQPRVALLLQTHLIRLVEAQAPPSIAEALLRRARIEAALGQSEEAKRDFEQSLERIGRLHPDERKRLAASIEVTRREIDESEDRPGAIARDFSSSTGAESLDLMDARSDFELRLGNTDAAEKGLERDMKKLETERLRMRSASDRISFLDRAHLIYQKAIALQLDLGHREKALEILERSRGRLPLDQIERQQAGSRPSSPLRVEEMISQLPPHTVIIAYGEVRGRLITWLIGNSGVQLIAEKSWRTVDLQVQKLRGDRDEIHPILADLYRQLVGPAKAYLDKDDRIIFIPTRSLYEVPFAALVESGSDRYLVQDHAVGIAPSVSEFIAAAEYDRHLSTKPPTTALLVGNPFILELPPLPGVRMEINRLKEIYHEPGTQLLMGAAATPARVLSSIGDAEIAHFSTHGVQDAKDPGRSRLLLASAGHEPGALFAQDVLQLHLAKTRLVVLAACDTQSGAISASEGSLSLASAFLAAGVPAVVGTLRPVEDESAARLSIRFHQELRNGADALSALRTAQVEEIERQNGGFNWTWASFQLLGGVTERQPSVSIAGEPKTRTSSLK